MTGRIPSAGTDAGIFAAVEERYPSAPIAAMQCVCLAKLPL